MVGHAGTVHVAHAHVGPRRDRPGAPAPGEPRIEPLGQAHFDGPGLAAGPAVAGDVVRGGGQGIGGVRVPAAASPVPVEIDAVILQHFGHDLRMPHGPGPASAHAREGRVTPVQGAERGHQLASEEASAPPVESQCRKGRDHGRVAHLRAVIAFHAPDRAHHLFLDPEPVFDRLQGAPVLAQLGAAHGDPVVRGGDG